MPDGPSDPAAVFCLLDEVGSPATVVSAGGRSFGFVTGGSLPATLAATWLASAWVRVDGAFGLWATDEHKGLNVPYDSGLAFVRHTEQLRAPMAVAAARLVQGGQRETTRWVTAGAQNDRACWCGGTVWHGRAAMRISVSSWATTVDDVDRSLAAMLRVAREQTGARRRTDHR